MRCIVLAGKINIIHLMGDSYRKYQQKDFLQDATCAIYKCEVTCEEYNRMRNKIRHMEQQKELYKYNLIGLFGVAMNIKIERDVMHFFVRNLLQR